MKAWNGSPITAIEGVAGIVSHREIGVACLDGIGSGAKDSERFSALAFGEAGIAGIAVAAIGRAGFGRLQLGLAVDSGEAFDLFAIHTKVGWLDGNGFVWETHQPFDVVLGRWKTLDRFSREVEGDSVEGDFLDISGIFGDVAEIHGNRRCGEDGDFVATWGAEIPEEAIDEDLIAGIDIAGPEALALSDFSSGAACGDGGIRVIRHVVGEQLLQIDFAAFEDVGRDLVGFSGDGEKDEAGGALGVGVNGERAVVGSDDIEIPAPVYEPLEGGKRLMGIEESRGSGVSARVDSIEGRLHGAGRNLERLEEVGSECERDAECDDEGFDDFEEDGIGACGKVRQDCIEGSAAFLGGIFDVFRLRGGALPTADPVAAGVQQAGMPGACKGSEDVRLFFEGLAIGGLHQITRVGKNEIDFLQEGFGVFPSGVKGEKSKGHREREKEKAKRPMRMDGEVGRSVFEPQIVERPAEARQNFFDMAMGCGIGVDPVLACFAGMENGRVVFLESLSDFRE